MIVVEFDPISIFSVGHSIAKGMFVLRPPPSKVKKKPKQAFGWCSVAGPDCKTQRRKRMVGFCVECGENICKACSARRWNGRKCSKCLVST